MYIGVTTQQDVQQVAESFNLNNVDSGNQVADVEAVVKHHNAQGGLFGRTIKPVFFDVKTSGDAEGQGQAACAHYTQDRPVVAVYQMALAGDTPSFRACMARAGIPVLAGGGQAFDDKVFDELKGLYTLMPFPSWTRFTPHFIDRLVAQQYFTPWDNAAGSPGAAPVKVGYLCPDTPIGRRVGALIAKELKRVGQPPAEQTFFDPSNADVSGFVLRYKAVGITHVLFCDLGLFVFASQAETQSYRPRYGVSTFNTPVLFLQGTVSPRQLRGAVGSGFIPTLDVDEARDPGPQAMPAAVDCRAIAKRGGVTYGPERRFAHGVLYDTCDVFQLLLSSAKTGNGLMAGNLLRGLAVEGTRLRSAITFRSGLSARDHAMPASTRDIHYDSACQCFRYRGQTLPMY